MGTRKLGYGLGAARRGRESPFPRRDARALGEGARSRRAFSMIPSKVPGAFRSYNTGISRTIWGAHGDILEPSHWGRRPESL